MPEPFWVRHDLHVLVVAGVILALGWVVQHQPGAARTKTVTRERVSVEVPAGWMAEPGAEATIVRGEDAVTRAELRVAERPSAQVPVDSSLELERGQRYGQVYQRIESGRIQAAGRTWLRTVYAYAFKPTPTHAPRLATAVEYAFPADAADAADHLYVVTVHGPEDKAGELERSILGTVRLR